MKVEVKELFVDKYDNLKAYQPGEIIDISNDRAKDLSKRGLAVIIDKPESPVNKAVKKVTRKSSK